MASRMPQPEDSSTMSIRVGVTRTTRSRASAWSDGLGGRLPPVGRLHRFALSPVLQPGAGQCALVGEHGSRREPMATVIVASRGRQQGQAAGEAGTDRGDQIRALQVPRRIVGRKEAGNWGVGTRG